MTPIRLAPSATAMNIDEPATRVSGSDAWMSYSKVSRTPPSAAAPKAHHLILSGSKDRNRSIRFVRCS